MNNTTLSEQVQTVLHKVNNLAEFHNINWIAQDDDGTWHGYVGKPSLDGDEYLVSGGHSYYREIVKFKTMPWPASETLYCVSELNMKGMSKEEPFYIDEDGDVYNYKEQVDIIDPCIATDSICFLVAVVEGNEYKYKLINHQGDMISARKIKPANSEKVVIEKLRKAIVEFWNDYGLDCPVNDFQLSKFLYDKCVKDLVK